VRALTRAPPKRRIAARWAGRRGGARAMEEAENQELDRSTHFVFQHRVFSLEGSYFSSGDVDEANFNMPLGESMAAVSLPALRREFSIDDESEDGKLLDMVEKSLRYVRAIRPNDNIPSEILNGTASWSVTEGHRIIARGKVTLQLVALITGNQDDDVSDLERLQQLSEDPETKARVDAAFGEIAEKLGLGRERKQDVVNWIDHLVDELSYIEGLRDRFREILSIVAKVGQMGEMYKDDRGIMEDLQRVQILIRPPMTEYNNLFDQVDAQTCEILIVLKDVARQVKLIRNARDELHYGFMVWDGIVEQWAAQTIERGEEAEDLIRETYKFLARNFQQTQDWELTHYG
jgi:hypothetical protein